MIKNHKVDISEAIRTLDSDSSFVINGEVTNEEEYINNVVFNSSPISWVDASSKQTELQTDYDNKKYQRDRKAEYPPMEDYLDGIVKDDQAQIDKYIADCKAIKDKYPKESE